MTVQLHIHHGRAVTYLVALGEDAEAECFRPLTIEHVERSAPIEVARRASALANRYGLRLVSVHGEDVGMLIVALQYFGLRRAPPPHANGADAESAA